MARETEYYLARPSAAIEFTACQVESMIEKGRSNEEISAFLVSEMDTYAPLVDNNNTGVYGYCRGEYMDASGWTPEEGYEATERPWYRAAKQASGKVAFTAPYMNLQTHVLMMSVSKLLNDGQSVVSMDIYLDGLQEIVKDARSEDCVLEAFVVDREGRIVVHTKEGETGKPVPAEGTAFQKALVSRVLEMGSGRFPTQGATDDLIVFSEPINEGWYAVILLNETKLLAPVESINFGLALVLLLATILWNWISHSIHRKYREAEQLTREVRAVADIYEAMLLVNLKTDRMTLLRSNDTIERMLGGDLSNYSGRIPQMVSQIAEEQYREMLLQFLGPSTYEERIHTVNSASHDFVDIDGRWNRVQLIVVDRESNGELRHIIWALESIDEEHKQREKWRLLAETDALSKVRNRRSGVASVLKCLEEGKKGVFILADIDRFKSINDTYGHKTGDLVIVAVAERLRKLFRDDDIVFRLGGDEFAVFLQDLENQADVDRICERIRKEISSIVLPELKGRTITISVGAAFYPEGEEDSFDTLYQRADKIMYENKRRGRSK